MRNFPNYLRFYKDEWHALEVPKVEFTRRKNAVEWEKWHFIAAAKLWLREREKKEKKGRRRRIPYPAERNGRRSSPYLFDRATASRERRFWTNLFHRVANLFHPTANTRPLFPPNKQKFCSTKELTFHELCNHEISINERFIRRYRRMKQKWEELIVQKIRKWRDWKKLLFNSTSWQDRLSWRVIIFELFARVYFRLDSAYKFIFSLCTATKNILQNDIYIT